MHLNAATKFGDKLLMTDYKMAFSTVSEGNSEGIKMLTKWANACYYWVYKFTCGRNSVVECRLPKPNAVGSNPIARFG